MSLTKLSKVLKVQMRIVGSTLMHYWVYVVEENRISDETHCLAVRIQRKPPSNPYISLLAISHYPVGLESAAVYKTVKTVVTCICKSTSYRARLGSFPTDLQISFSSRSDFIYQMRPKTYEANKNKQKSFNKQTKSMKKLIMFIFHNNV